MVPPTRVLPRPRRGPGPTCVSGRVKSFLPSCAGRPFRPRMTDNNNAARNVGCEAEIFRQPCLQPRRGGAQAWGYLSSSSVVGAIPELRLSSHQAHAPHLEELWPCCYCVCLLAHRGPRKNRASRRRLRATDDAFVVVYRRRRGRKEHNSCDLAPH